VVYIAHIVTSDAGEGVSPEVAVTTADAQSGVTEPLISYPLPRSARVADAVATLHAQGWSLDGTRRFMERGYWVAQLHATDWAAIVRAVTGARQEAEIERQCRETAWQIAVDGAMDDHHIAPEVIAQVAGMSADQRQVALGDYSAAPPITLP
jgi:hypothetical protein